MSSAQSGAYRYPAFRRVWLGSVLLAVGTWSERLIVGWFALQATGSPLFTAATFAARQAPAMLFAPLGGAVSDRFRRNRTVLVVALYRTLAVAVLAWGVATDISPLWIMVIVGFAGIGTSFEMPAIQALVSDSVPVRARMNAVSLWSVGTRAVGAVGALGSGIAIATFGIPSALLAGAAVMLTGGLIIGTHSTSEQQQQQASRTSAGVLTGLRAGITTIVNTPTVRALLLAALVVEIFGFAFHAVLPVFASNALGVGEVGLGTLGMAIGFGSVAGVGVLSALGDYRRKGLLLIGACLAFGASLVALSLTREMWVAVAFAAALGSCAAMFDAMQWTLLQAQVPDEMRGRVISAWVFTIGFGWIGHLGLGAVAEVLGIQIALGGAGVLLGATGIILLMTAPKVRRA